MAAHPVPTQVTVSRRCPGCGARFSGRFCTVCGMSPAPVKAQLVSLAPKPTAQGSVLHATQGSLLPGTILAGRYRIDAVLARGSMGTVYQIEDLRPIRQTTLQGLMGHAVIPGRNLRALKELQQEWNSPAEQAEAEEWFRREGTTLMRLQHPSIPQVFDRFSIALRLYLVMELVEGRTLEQVLADEGRPGLAQDRVLGWADQLLDVLGYLHGRHTPMIFRDLKPANVMLTPAGQIRLVDFGIARDTVRLARATAIGTPGYAPPEQYKGFAEPASDLYALGATLHHLLTGHDPCLRRPFVFPPVRSLAPQVSAAVAEAVDRSLAFDARDRFDSAAQMRQALHRCIPVAQPSLPAPRAPQTIAPGAGTLVVLPQAPAPVLQPQVITSSIQPLPQAAVAAKVGDLRVRPRALTIRYAETVLLTRLDRRTVILANRSAKRLLCTIDSDQAWLRPDRPTVWLEPHSLVEVALGIAWSEPSSGSHRATLLVQGGGQTWTVPVDLEVGTFSARSHYTKRCDLGFAPLVLGTVLGAAVLSVEVARIALVLAMLGALAIGVAVGMLLLWMLRRRPL